jgi:GrpB-like predicted nucleotidyltransferase (UPF0157 family)
MKAGPAEGPYATTTVRPVAARATAFSVGDTLGHTGAIITEVTRVSPVEEFVVTVVASDPRWPTFFEEESGALRLALDKFSPVVLEHFGSTSVPGLAAKPVVDILWGLPSSAPPPEDALNVLSDLDYLYLGQDGRRRERWFWRKRLSERSHPDEASCYAELKMHAAASHPTSLLDYQDAKRAFVIELSERADTWTSQSPVL